MYTIFINLKNPIDFINKNSFSFLYQYIYYIRFVNDLKINGFCRWFSESYVNFSKTSDLLTEFCPALGGKLEISL